MTKRRKYGAVVTVLLVLVLHAGLPAVAGNPARFVIVTAAALPQKMSVDTMNDGLAGKGADLAVIAHSPTDGRPHLCPNEALVVVNIFAVFQGLVRKRDPD